ncbi:ABC transporter substrate-binding protein [Actomonas aquatica]|uniref:ABC transporter substrate-binding protein n=1 Tax=Actomonas aquatica TaxID=2866162 RepID=A0ABZ1CHI6_9BACT|nr:ABC transporter substrate-binding protein [Opitutus sp. WL0086]WRQ89730.1 ABC transporter substrate-binding protein [Opitutus sp. WL0086]
MEMFRLLHLGFRLLAGGVGLFAGGLGVARAEAVRIVSQTVGTDEIVLALAEPEQIAALSHLAYEPVYSAVAEEAKAYPKIERGDAETILKYRPTLVIGADYSRVELLEQIERAGVKVIKIEHYGTLTDAYHNLRMIAAAIGPEAEAKAERIIADGEARVAALEARLANVEPVKVIAPSTYGVIGGAGTTFQDLCDHAGAENLATTLGGLEGHAPPPVESMLTWPIEKVVLAADSVDDALAPYAKLPPYAFMASIREKRVALIAPYMLSSVSHHRIKAYEALARELHPEVFSDG